MLFSIPYSLVEYVEKDMLILTVHRIQREIWEELKILNKILVFLIVTFTN